MHRSSAPLVFARKQLVIGELAKIGHRADVGRLAVQRVVDPQDLHLGHEYEFIRARPADPQRQTRREVQPMNLGAGRRTDHTLREMNIGPKLWPATAPVTHVPQHSPQVTKSRKRTESRGDRRDRMQGAALLSAGS